MKGQNEKTVSPVPAATVILLREHAGEVQVYLLRRSKKSGFMAGNYVFPGGTVDEQDRKPQIWLKRVDLDSAEISLRLGGNLSTAEALAYSVAGIRETLEEAGVFLAFRNNQQEEDLERVCLTRLAADLPADWFTKIAVSEQWTLKLSGLFRWSHWVTPELMKRRFDTRFFIAAMPPEQICRPDSRETTHGIWVSPGKALAGNLSGEIPLSPPGVVTLQEILPYKSMAQLQEEAANRRWGAALIPRLVLQDKEAVIVEPWDPMYGQEKIALNTNDLARVVLPAGQPFSRMWLDNGLWKPIRIQTV
jgi:8-oxo-dGTP pyrophosphatase MutT (NUDIX family)